MTSRYRLIWLGLLWLGILAGCTQRPTVVVQTPHGQVAVPVEVADTPERRMRGLMYRTDLPEDGGMIFLFPQDADQSFWMKNTPLPLDMIFISRERQIVGIVHDTKPFSLEPRGVGRPSRYVLEVHAGFAAKHGLAEGQRVEFRDVPPDPAS